MGKKIFEFFTLKMFAYLDLCMGNLFSYILLKFTSEKEKIIIERICKPIICQDLVSLTSGKKITGNLFASQSYVYMSRSGQCSSICQISFKQNFQM